MGMLEDSSERAAYRFDGLQSEDTQRFGAARGEPKFNALWKAWAAAVSLRAWRQRFAREAPASVSSDHLGELAVLQQRAVASPA
eukprot:4443885-Alexandrium_andersonii.AAC.1